MSNQNTSCCDSDQARSLRNISIAGFVVTELTMYLDTHPDDRNALSHFNYYNRILNRMTEEFSSKYYPLNLSSVDASNKEWKWGMAPLPWERM